MPKYDPANSCLRPAAPLSRAMPWARSSSGSPMPESMRSCGELMTPPQRITSSPACATTVRPRWTYSTPTARLPSNMSLRHQRINFDSQVFALPAPAADRRRRRCSGGRRAPSFARRRNLPAAHRCNPASSCSRRLVPAAAKASTSGSEKRGHLGRQRAVAAAIKARPAFPGFLAAEIRKHVGVGPCRQSRRRPAVVVAADGRAYRPWR